MLRRSAAPVRLVPFILALALVAAACGGGADESAQPSGPSATGATPVGGTLKLALQSDVQEAFDPQKEYYGVAWAFDRCCLLRTLLSYNGKTTAEGGAEVKPDLAAALPEQSADGLTWTFTLKPGIKYAPPLEDVTVTAQDFIRAMEREACGTCSTGGYSFYYSTIEGFDEFAAGDADTITGLEAPDDSTLDRPHDHAHRRPAVPDGDARRGTDPTAPGRPEGAAGHRHRARRQLRTVHRRHRALHVRGHRPARLLAPGGRPGAGLRVRRRAFDRPGPQPVVRPVHGRPARGLRRPHRGHDRRRLERSRAEGRHGRSRHGLRRRAAGGADPQLRHQPGPAGPDPTRIPRTRSVTSR